MNEGARSYLIATPEKDLCDKLYTLSPVRNKKEMYDLLFEDLYLLCDLYKTTNHKILKKVLGDYDENNS